ncbi:hypothetical protein [Halorussus sp. MSC15.2]|uniref:hypothetical protein n=1 Tax=Halorussus sp. MSC15.2 TaxID=2283638 RepID=UPI0013D12B55|nr:hypothetical protein [Halorussus sp. MSC15.2]NEU58388.1 hypothetical protein [Halorussus sp. MSC15.2]
MRKIDVLMLLALFHGSLLSLGDGAVVGVPLLLASAYLLAKPRARRTRERGTTAATARSR